MKKYILIIITTLISSCYILKSSEPCEYPIFDYNHFDLTRIVPVGHAQLKNDIIYLTENYNNQSGSAWKNSPVDITSGFTSTFTFEFRNGDNRLNYDGSLEGGDGVAFVIAGEPFGVGTYGAGIGYSGLKKAVAIEFDTYRNNVETVDPNGNHAAFQIPDETGNVTSKHSPETTLAMNDKLMIMKDFVKYKVKVEYSAKDKKVVVYFDTLDIPLKICLEVNNIDLSKYLANPKACFVGITGGTGVAVANQYLHSWQFCQRAIPTSINDLESNQFNSLIEYDEVSVYNEIGERVYYSNNTSLDLIHKFLPKNKALFVYSTNQGKFNFEKIIIE
ncbi:MAG: L-type lectin-domain containing protein [Candidatus Kapabacteria bacterium]|nr:L-type lectin-domain containing protein [Candidatus Kapabacteria bacterium]